MKEVPETIDPSVEEKILEMVHRIADRFDPERIILFGSHAQGAAGPDSDVDLLVIKKSESSKFEDMLKIRAALNGVGLAKDVVVADPEEVERFGDLVGTVLYPALRVGKVLYERPVA